MQGAVAPKLLSIYLNDHMVALVSAGQLARRVAGSNEGEPLGTLASSLVDELDAELGALREVMAATGVTEDRIKRVAGLVGERLGRLKLNGQLTGYSPLSRLVEVEALILLSTGSELLWRTLAERGLGDAEWAERASARIAALQDQRTAAAERALA